MVISVKGAYILYIQCVLLMNINSVPSVFINHCKVKLTEKEESACHLYMPQSRAELTLTGYWANPSSSPS